MELDTKKVSKPVAILPFKF